MKRITLIFTAATSLFFSACGEDTANQPSDGRFAVVLTASDGGSATASIERAAPGATVTIAATASEGYMFARWVVTEGGATLASATSPTTTFVMPKADVAVAAEFAVRKITDDGVVVAGVTWATTNVGEPGTFVPQPTSPGMLYQFDRRIGFSSTEPMTTIPLNEKWQLRATYDYLQTSSWAEANNPCPDGWRLPEDAELMALLYENGNSQAGSATVIAAAETRDGVPGFAFHDKDNEQAVLFLPTVGWRESSQGILAEPGQRARYWSSTALTGSAKTLTFTKDAAAASINLSFSHGASVRCVKK